MTLLYMLERYMWAILKIIVYVYNTKITSIQSAKIFQYLTPVCFDILAEYIKI